MSRKRLRRITALGVRPKVAQLRRSSARADKPTCPATSATRIVLSLLAISSKSDITGSDSAVPNLTSWARQNRSSASTIASSSLAAADSVYSWSLSSPQTLRAAHIRSANTLAFLSLSAAQPLGRIAVPATTNGPLTRTLKQRALLPNRIVGPSTCQTPGTNSAAQSPCSRMRSIAVSDSNGSINSMSAGRGARNTKWLRRNGARSGDGA